ncbi:Gfo/Idh/MocA family protein [Aquirufa antheringensis]
MNILFIGFSAIIQNRIIPAIEDISSINYIDCASLSKSKDTFITFKARNFYNNYEIALSESDAEIVYISVRNHDHANLVKQALNYNKHVIVDKPGVTKIEDAEEIIRIANGKNKCISEALVFGYHPQLDLVRRIFKDNNENPSHISVHFSMPGFFDENFRYKKEFDGGAIFDLGPYAMSIGSEFFGEEPLSCLGTKHIRNGLEVETSFSILLQFPGGRTLMGYFGFETEYINSVTIFSHHMSINFERIFTIPRDFENEIKIRYKNILSIEKAEKADIFKEYLIDVIAGIRNNEFNRFKFRFLNNARLLTTLKNILN